MMRLGIFDIDGTVFRWSLLIEVVDAFIKEGIFPKKSYQEIVDEDNAWHDRKINYNIFLKKVRDTYYKYLPGVKEKDVKRIVEKIITQKKDRVYRFTRDLILKLKREGYYLLIISNSPLYIVSEFAHHWEFDKFYGTESEIKNGVFTGHFIPANNKSDVLDAFIKENPNRFNLKDSIAIGDTESDIAVLKRVGRPIAFNPNVVLTKYAREKEWSIVVERKDVIYDLHKFEIIEKV